MTYPQQPTGGNGWPQQPAGGQWPTGPDQSWGAQQPPPYSGYPPAQYPAPQPGWGQQPPAGPPSGGGRKKGLAIGLGAAAVVIAVAVLVAVFAFTGDGGGISALGGKSSLADLSKDQLKALLPTPDQYPAGFVANPALNDSGSRTINSNNLGFERKKTVTPAGCDNVGSPISNDADAKLLDDKGAYIVLQKSGKEANMLVVAIVPSNLLIPFNDVKGLVAKCPSTTTTEGDGSGQPDIMKCTYSLADAPKSPADEALAIHQSCVDPTDSNSGLPPMEFTTYLGDTRGLSIYIMGGSTDKDGMNQVYTAAIKKIDDK